MTDHVKTKHKLQNIPTKLEFNTLLDSIVLSDKERRLMQLYYVERKDFDFIADELGYTKSGVLKIHRRILKRIEALI